MPRLSVAAIERLKSDPNKRREIADAGKPGLYLVIQPSGAKSWAIRYRHKGRACKLTLDGFPSLTAARKLAQDALDVVAHGKDPAAQKRAVRNMPSSRIHDVFAEFLAKHVKKKNGLPIRESSRRETGRLLGLQPATADLSKWEPRVPKSGVLARWHGRDVLSITKRDGLNLVDSMVERGSPVGANRTLAAIKTAFTWMVKRDILPASPFDHVDHPSPEKPAARKLSEMELIAAWRAAEAMGYPYGSMVQFLMLVGQRPGEVRKSVRREIDLSKRLWVLNPERTKNGREHHVPLSDMAVAILEALPMINGQGWHFTLEGEVPVSNLSRMKDKLDALMLAELQKIDADVTKLEYWRLHDLRHVLKTWMQEARIPKDVRNAVQNHFDGDMDEYYGHHTYAAEKRDALDRWARHLEALLSGKPGNVVSLARRA